MAKKEQTTSQFMHLELYSRSGNATTGKTSTGGVIWEATRVEGFTDHIVADGFTPVAPTYLYSQNNLTLDVHYENILAQVETEKDGLGRKIKSDKNILLAGVVSFPKPRVAVWSDDDKQDFITFKEQSIEFMKKQWGDNLLCVLEHTDEQYPHLHFYVVNKTRIASTPEMHPGFAENIRIEKEAKALNQPVNKKEQVKAYKDAMRKFQDDFYQTVSVYCGLDRLGPKAQRLNRNEWKEKKRATKLLAKAFKKVKEQAADINIKSNTLNISMLELEQQIANVIDMQVQVEKDQQAIAKGVEDLELAKFVKENYPQIATNFKMKKIRRDATEPNSSLMKSKKL
ncbi:MAG: plasmid recombination protein [Methylophilus sp.]|uniref:plasmid recombination protein n=1 Tax=Methylophilus sp. TaxID=29541 RepID=UPI003F9F1C27